MARTGMYCGDNVYVYIIMILEYLSHLVSCVIKQLLMKFEKWVLCMQIS